MLGLGMCRLFGGVLWSRYLIHGVDAFCIQVCILLLILLPCLLCVLKWGANLDSPLQEVVDGKGCKWVVIVHEGPDPAGACVSCRKEWSCYA